MKCGRLINIVEIHSYKSVESDFGGTRDSWVFSRKARCSIKRVNGSVDVNAGELFEAVTILLEMHRYQDVKITDRIKYDDSMWRVIDTYINNDTSMRVVKCDRINE